VTDQQAFTVEPYGCDEDFDGHQLAGRSYAVELGSFAGCGAASALMEIVAGESGAYLEILDVAGQQAEVRLVWVGDLEDPEDRGCVLAQRSASLQSGGRLEFQVDHLQVSTDPPIEAWDLSLRLGWVASADRAAGLEGQVTVQLADLEERLAEYGDPCEISAMLGAECYECPDGSGPSCASMMAFAGQMEAADVEFDDALPRCGASRLPGERPFAEEG